MQEVIKRIYDYSLEEIMGERFGRYAKTIIQDRALPDVRDGLKPVQRRILYGMYRDRNTYDNAYKKSAKTVGNVMGQYHPHGDSSIYEAMVRMSQWWKSNTIFVDMHGNNGSMDGDGPAAMRYTEARLAKISNELLKDIDKNTIKWAPNYDDTLLEPTVLPAKFPNLLVNGATGISAGYATNIPPNLGEIIDATIKRIDSPNCHVDTILEIVKGPDFPTGAIVEGIEGIRDALLTGRGKIIVKSKLEVVKNKGKEQIIISQIPYEVNKALLVKKIDEIRIDKKVEGIMEVRDESDRNGQQIAIDLKNGANTELILNYLYKNTDLMVSYNYNMVAIVNSRPMTLGIIPILDAYIKHQREVITNRTKFDLEVAKKRIHIVEGLIKALGILDKVIATIRQSKNKSDAIENLVTEFAFSQEQSKAIVELQLYRLTNTDVTELEEELHNLEKIIIGLNAILSNEDNLKEVMKKELKNIKKDYATPRLTEIKNEITEIKIDTTSMIPKEDVIVVVTKDGYLKRVSTRSYGSSDGDTLVKDGDYPIGIYEMNTMDIIKVSSEDNIIYSYPVYNFEEEVYVTSFSKNGMVKRTKLEDFKVQRYSKPMTSMKLKADDKIVNVCVNNYNDVFITTKNGLGLWYNSEEIGISGIKASGVKAISLKNDFVVSGTVFNNNEFVTIITDKGTGKRVRINEFTKTSRARKGMQMVREVKTNPYKIIKSFITTSKFTLGIKSKDNIDYLKASDLPIADRYSTGTQICKTTIQDLFIKTGIEDKVEEIKEEPKAISLQEIDEKILTIDDFLDNFEE